MLGARIDLMEAFIQKIERRIRTGEEEKEGFGRLADGRQDFGDNVQPVRWRNRRCIGRSRKPEKSISGEDDFKDERAGKADKDA